MVNVCPYNVAFSSNFKLWLLVHIGGFKCLKSRQKDIDSQMGLPACIEKKRSIFLPVFFRRSPKRRRSRSRSSSRKRKHRKRSRSRSRDRKRKTSRSYSSERRAREREKERQKKGLPPIRSKTLSGRYCF